MQDDEENSDLFRKEFRCNGPFPVSDESLTDAPDKPVADMHVDQDAQDQEGADMLEDAQDQPDASMQVPDAHDKPDADTAVPNAQPDRMCDRCQEANCTCPEELDTTDLRCLRDGWFFDPPPGPGAGLSINDWAQREIDEICWNLDKMYLNGGLKTFAYLHKMSPEALEQRFPTHVPFASDQPRETEPPSALEEAMAAAIQSNNFPAQGGMLGNFWARTWKHECADAYAEATEKAGPGEKRQAQQEFRMKFLKGKYEALRKSRLRVDTYRTVQRSVGTFEPPNVIWAREGKGKAGLRATKHLCQMAIAVGSRFLSWNSATRRLEILHVRKEMMEEMQQLWELRREQHAVTKQGRDAVVHPETAAGTVGVQKEAAESGGVRQEAAAATVGVQKGAAGRSGGVHTEAAAASTGVQQEATAAGGVQKGEAAASTGVQKGEAAASTGVQQEAAAAAATGGLTRSRSRKKEKRI